MFLNHNFRTTTSLIVPVCLSMLVFWGCGTSEQEDRMDLQGEWQVQLDSLDVGEAAGWTNQSFAQTMWLPGTTDGAGLGEPNRLEPAMEQPQLTHLTRNHRYEGAAWYTREVCIPASWEGRDLRLNLERVIWKTAVWVDGQRLEQHNESLIAPHVFDLTAFLTPGKCHRITIQVDNRKQFDVSVRNLAHAYTDHTQIIWNGIIGDLSLEALPKVRVESVQIYPDISNKRVKVSVVSVNNQNSVMPATLGLQATLQGGASLGVRDTVLDVPRGIKQFDVFYPMDDSLELWDEFSPQLYTLAARLDVEGVSSTVNSSFGMRELARDGQRLLLNGNPIFLRGTLECNIFPLTGHPPMDRKGWEKVMATAKSWGLNHLRFHSWCPPKAAFEVADELGMFLQVELPAWTLNIGQDSAAVAFLYDEAYRMMESYGNHPSFCFWSMGNELQGDMAVLNNMVRTLKQRDGRHLYSATTYTFEPGHGDWPEPADDFFVTQKTRHGWVRGQGVFNDHPPSFDTDYREAVGDIPVPLITHEIGQYAVYPNLREIEKYTGVLLPLNFMAIRDDLTKKGLADRADAYTHASGKLAAALYKEEIERALRTPGISGFQLLDLHDFPGQGTALVGLLDAFWDSKGIIEAKEFQQFCAPVVPLLRFPKATYSNGERFRGTLEVSNFSGRILADQRITYRLKAGDQVLEEGNVIQTIGHGNQPIQLEMDFSLASVETASKLSVEVSLDHTTYQNSWNIWVYPETGPVDFGEVSFTKDYETATKWLNEGKKVLFNPDWKQLDGIVGKFVPVFWSPVHFPKQAGTMGVLCDPHHPALAGFPNDGYTDWQWWDLNTNATTMMIDSLKGGKPIIEMVDNFANNRRLALLLEGRVGQGKLVMSSIDITTDLEQRKEAKQLLLSIVKYMNGADFSPDTIENPEYLERMVNTGIVRDKENPEGIY